MGRTVSDAVNDLFVQRPPARRPDPAVAEARSCLSGQTTVTRTDAIVGTRNVEQDQPDAGTGLAGPVAGMVRRLGA